MNSSMIAFTIGVGPKFAPLAKMAAASCAARTGLPVTVLGEEAMARHGLKVPNHLKGTSGNCKSANKSLRKAEKS